MRRVIISLIAAASLVAVGLNPAVAEGEERRRVRGRHCGDNFRNRDNCSFRYKGGLLYVGGSVRGSGTPSGVATIRLEANSRRTGQRRVLLSCTTPASGSCTAAGTYETSERLRDGQRLFCIVDGSGRGEYECGTMVKHR